MTLAPHVAVVPHRMVRGLRVPKDGKTWDFTKVPHTPGNEAAIVPHCRVLPIVEACSAKWRSDALMMAPVVMRDGAPVFAQPRLTKDSLDAVRAAGFDVVCWALIADFDSVPKLEWDDARRAAQLEKILDHPAFARGLWWFTARGLRLVHALKEPVPVEQYEDIARAWREELLDDGLGADEFGLHLDPACKDWTRLQGLRDVQRPDGLFQSYPLGGRLVLRDCPSSDLPKHAPRKKPARLIKEPRAFAETIPEQWVGRAHALATAMLRVEEGWNDAFLCLSGALVQRGVPAGDVPAIISAVSIATQNDDRTENRVINARRTVERAARGEPIRGWDALLVNFPRVASALERALVNLCQNGDVLPSLAAARQELQEAIRSAPEGVSGVEAGCGVGKTRAWEDVSIERAGRGKKHDTKTVLSVPTNALARQFAANVARRGLPVLRLFSPPSELGPDGAPVCKYAASARAIAGSGLSVPYEFCNGRGDAQRACPYRDDCTVADGFEGDPDAKIIVGNHGLMSRLAKDAGKTGLLGIDEPPPVLVTHRLAVEDLRRLREMASSFGTWFEGVRPALETCEWWITDMLAGPPVDLVRVAVEGDVAAARSVPTQPQVRWGDVARARASVTYAAMLGQAARAASVLRSVWGSEARWVVWVEEREVDGAKVRALMLTGPDEQLVDVLRREGRTVLLDAALDTQALSAAAGYDLSGRVTRVWARDGAPVARTWIRWGAGSRRHLMKNGELQIGVFASGLRHALRWANEDPRCKRVGLFCIKPFRACIDAGIALLTQEERARERARDCLTKSGVPSRYLDTIEGSILPVLRSFDGAIETGHYGSLRGLDNWIGVDATITLGDPWPHLLSVRHEHSYFASTGADSRSRWMVERELEQAHGRLRAPGLTRHARALHVGAVLPRGPGWDQAEYRTADAWRPKTDAAMTADELRAWISREHGGSVSAAARALEISRETLRRYLLPKARAIPSDVAARVRGATESLIRGISIKAFGGRDTPAELCDGVSLCDDAEEQAL